MTPIKYKIVSMEAVQSNMTSENYDAKGKVTMNNTFSFGINNKDTIVFRIIHTLTLYCNEKVFAEISLQTFIDFAKDTLESLKKENKLEIPRDFLIQCGSISYGSMRGVLIQEAKKAGLPNIVLPPYYISTLIDDSLAIEL